MEIKGKERGMGSVVAENGLLQYTWNAIIFQDVAGRSDGEYYL
jgi:hypothetical protein